MSLQQQTLYTIMINSITLAQVKQWENLVDMDNTGDEIQALDCYLVDEGGESCSIDDAVDVVFYAYYYDHKHDFDNIKSTLREVGVELDEDTLITDRGDFEGAFNTSSGGTKYVQCPMFIAVLKLVLN